MINRDFKVNWTYSLYIYVYIEKIKLYIYVYIEEIDFQVSHG